MGSEALVHSMRTLKCSHGHLIHIGMASVDLRNAFNLVSRATIVRKFKRHLTPRFAWMKYCYGSHVNSYLWTNSGFH